MWSPCRVPAAAAGAAASSDSLPTAPGDFAEGTATISSDSLPAAPGDFVEGVAIAPRDFVERAVRGAAAAPKHKRGRPKMKAVPKKAT